MTIHDPLTLHERAIAEYSGGWLVLAKRKVTSGSIAWSTELQPVTCDTELEALRAYYALTQDGLLVAIHPDPVPKEDRPRTYRLVRKDDDA